MRNRGVKFSTVLPFILLLAVGSAASVLVFNAFESPSDVYSTSTFYPPEGKVLHIAGQAREEFADYIENVTENGGACDLPGGAAFYTSLGLTGLTTPWTYITGDPHQDLPYLASVYEPLTFQIALWLGSAQLKTVPEGYYDYAIDQMAEIFKSYDMPIYFRIGYEFDGMHNAYDPGEYKATYRYIVDRFRAADVTNVAYVWHSYALIPTYGNLDVMEWYPGDDYVDWIGISFFNINITEEDYYSGINRDRLLEIAQEKQRPIMICESSASRYRPSLKELSGQAYWDYWYVPCFEFIESNPEVKAFSIINCDWDSLQQFGYLNWGDAVIAHDPVVLEHWREKMQEERYLHSNPELYEQLGYGVTSSAEGFPLVVLGGIAAIWVGVIGLGAYWAKRRL